MKHLILILLFLSTASCTVVTKLTETAEKVQAALAKANEVYEHGMTIWDSMQEIYKLSVAEMKDAKLEADKNEDGKTTFDEWWGWIASGGLAAWLARERLKRQQDALLARNEHSDSIKARMQAEIDDLKAKLKT